jgi:hypothetical protein
MRGDDKLVKKIAKGLKWKISKKYSWRLDGWSWIKHLAGNKFYFQPWGLHWFNILFHVPFVWISKLMKPGDGNFKGLIKRFFYSYAQHLVIWEVATTKDSWLKKLTEKILLLGVEKRNILLRMLLRDKSILDYELYKIQPMTDFQWQRWYTDATFSNKSIYNHNFFPYENILDIDVLKFVMENYATKYKNKTNIIGIWGR